MLVNKKFSVPVPISTTLFHWESWRRILIPSYKYMLKCEKHHVFVTVPRIQKPLLVCKDPWIKNLNQTDMI